MGGGSAVTLKMVFQIDRIRKTVFAFNDAINAFHFDLVQWLKMWLTSVAEISQLNLVLIRAVFYPKILQRLYPQLSERKDVLDGLPKSVAST